MARFRMEQIKIDQFAILSNETSGNLRLETNLGIGANKELQSISVQLMIKYHEKEETKLLLQISCYFSVHPKDWEEFVKTDKVILPKGFLAHLAMHTFGTARGILYCKAEDTPYQKFILPPTNVEMMIERDIEI